MILNVPESLYRVWNQLNRLRQSRWLVVFVNIVIGLILITILGRSLVVNWKQILGTGLVIRPFYLGAALGLYGITFLLFVIVWHKIAVRFGGPTSWKRNTIFYSITHLTKFLPTPIWLFASRAYLYNQAGVQHRTTLLMTGLENFLHATVGLAFWSVLTINPERPTTWLLLIPIAIGMVLLFFASWPVKIPRLRRVDIALWGGLYLLTWIAAGPFLYAIICVFGEEAPPIWDLYRIWTLASLAAYLGSYVLGGAGFLREMTLVWLLSKFYLPPIAVLISAAVRLLMIGGSILWGAIISSSCVISLYRFNEALK